MQPDLSVIIVTHNGREMALATLRSALGATDGVRVEWIVVDSGSTDGVADAISDTWPDIDVVRSGNHGFAAGNNVGLRRARGRYVLLLNPDVEVARGTLAELVRALDERPEVGLASVVQLATDGSLQRSIRRFPSVLRDAGESLLAAHWPILRNLQELEMRDSRYQQEHSVDWMVGAFLIARGEALDVVGLMDERFFLYSEEVDWCYRFRRAGWDVRHLPLMTIVHHAGGRDRGDLMSQLAHSRKLFAHKHFGPVKSRAIRAALMLGHVVRLLGLAPTAVRSASARARLGSERRALAVQMGITAPPQLGAPATASLPGPAPEGRAHPGRSYGDTLTAPEPPR
jgi:N-acetylglucosaminyl-diphospho-decaprenol L-rhamnosyltransferase